MVDPIDFGDGGRGEKSNQAFRTISEVAKDLDVAQHVLRFWETKFTQISPLKRGGGRRYYRPEDVALLTRIRDLLYREGYTIKGVQKLLREQGRRGADTKAGSPGGDPTDAAAPVHAAVETQSTGLSTEARLELQSISRDLKDLKILISRAVGG